MRVYSFRGSRCYKLAVVSFVSCGLIQFIIFIDNNYETRSDGSLMSESNQNIKNIPGGVSEMSTCSAKATSRGRNQKVVSFSFFGNTNISYFKGIEANAMKVEQIYPGWVMRVYHNISLHDTEGSQRLGTVLSKYPHLDDCFIHDLPTLGNINQTFGAIWRFMTMGDPLVDVFVSRDLDSVMVQREVDAVNDWLHTNATWHIMRDNPHHKTTILAGMWGAINSNLTLMQEIRNLFLSSDIPHFKQLDQFLLDSLVWPITVNSSVVHDSFLCAMYPRNTRPFPTRRINGTFVGGFEGMQLNCECPLQCRPNEHKDWIYC